MKGTRLAKAVAVAGAALLLMAPVAHANETDGDLSAKQCVNGNPPPAGIDQWCILIMEGDVIVGFQSNRYGSPSNTSSWYVYVCQKPSPEFIGVCADLPR